jgi:hypothetical protein
MLRRWFTGARSQPLAGAPPCSSDGTPIQDVEREYIVSVFRELQPGSSAREAAQQLGRHGWSLQPALCAAGSADDTRTPAPEQIAETAAKERPPDQVFAMDESNVGTAPSRGAPSKLKSEVLQLLQAWDVSDAADALVKHG